MWTLTYAFGLKEDQISGAPDWLNDFTPAYDIEAKPASPVDEEECRLMLQSLFIDRFKLLTHRQAKDAPVYVLTIGKNGSKLREGGTVRINGLEFRDSGKPKWPNGVKTGEFARIISRYTDRPVLDRTGLQGSYGATLTFSLSDGDGKPNIFAAVQDQLGLKLEASRALIEMLVIDRIQRPDPN
jgi:uncharacterized protein (TIGR03435 family)